MSSRDPAVSPAFVYGLGAAVAVCWIASVAASIIWRGQYDTPIALHGLMGTVIGSVFADSNIRKARARLRRTEDDDAPQG